MRRIPGIFTLTLLAFALTMDVAAAVSIGDLVDLGIYGTGHRSTPSDVFVGGDWNSQGFRIGWTISESNGSYNYAYTLSHANGGTLASPDLSHWIVQVSEDFITPDNWQHYISPAEGASPEVGSFSDSNNGNSNPGLSETLYGMKFDQNFDGAFTTSFESTQRPVWGNFYAKGGQDTYAMNTGLRHVIETSQDFPDGRTHYIPTVDTKPGKMIPEPATMALGMTALAGCAVAFWRRQW